MNTKPKSYQDVVELAKSNNCQWIDLKFVDMPGVWQHFSIPMNYLDEEMFTDGIGFDGSSIRGFQKINESNMLLVLDATTAIVDPACDIPTLSVICDVKDPITGKQYSRDPRYVAKKAEAYLRRSGLGDVSYWGPELEFFIFNSIRFDQNMHEGYYHIDSEEGIWNTGNHLEEGNLGYRIRTKEGYFPVPPTDKQQDLRTEIGNALMKSGIDIEVHHHEVATGGQAEFSMKFDTLVTMADKTLRYKYICKNVSNKNGYTATFMPKPLFQDNGSGMHVHQSIWKDGKNLFFDAKGYGLISELAKNYIGGLLKHSPALLAFCAPSTNSYRRLVPGVMRLLSTLSIRSATAVPPSVSRCTQKVPSRSASNIAAPMPPATPTWLTRPCLWPDLMA